ASEADDVADPDVDRPNLSLQHDVTGAKGRRHAARQNGERVPAEEVPDRDRGQDRDAEAGGGEQEEPDGAPREAGNPRAQERPSRAEPSRAGGAAHVLCASQVKPAVALSPCAALLSWSVAENLYQWTLPFVQVAGEPVVGSSPFA